MSSRGSFTKAGFWARCPGTALALLFLPIGAGAAPHAEGLRAVWRGSMVWANDQFSEQYSRSTSTLLPHEFRDVFPGSRFSVGLRTDGTLHAWGLVPSDFPRDLQRVRSVAMSSDGGGVALLEEGTVVALTAEFGPPAGLSNVVEVAMSGGGGIARKADGTVSVWGVWRSTPGTPPPIHDAVAVAMDSNPYVAVALRADGSVVAWQFDSGNLVALPASFRGIRQIVLGAGALYGLREDGTVAGWGGVSSGMPPGLSGVKSLVNTGSATIALRNDGTVVAWGYHGSDGMAVPPGLSGVTSIAADRGTAYALRSDGTVVAWGSSGPLPDMMSQGVSRIVAGPHSGVVVCLGKPVVPVLVRQPVSQETHAFQGVRFEVEAAGFGLTYRWFFQGAPVSGATNRVLRLDGLRVGDGTLSAGEYFVAVTNPNRDSVFSAPVYLTVNKRVLSGTVVEWGPSGIPSRSPPEGIHGRVVAMDAGPALTVALLADGSVQGWSADQVFLHNPPAGGLRPDNLAVAGAFWVLRTSDGRVTAWDGWGRAANAAPWTGIVAITGGPTSGALLAERGFVWRWLSGQSDTPQLYPVSGIQAVDASGSGVVMLRQDGTVVLGGLRNAESREGPVGLTNVVAIAAGFSHWVALRRDGSVSAWDGEDPADTAVPAGLGDVVAIAAGHYHTLALRRDGTLVGWGRVALPGANPWTPNWQAFRVPPGLREVSAIAAGGGWSAVLLGGRARPQIRLESAAGTTSAVWHESDPPATLQSAAHAVDARWTSVTDPPLREGRWRRAVIPTDHASRFLRLSIP